MQAQLLVLNYSVKTTMTVSTPLFVVLLTPVSIQANACMATKSLMTIVIITLSASPDAASLTFAAISSIAISHATLIKTVMNQVRAVVKDTVPMMWYAMETKQMEITVTMLKSA